MTTHTLASNSHFLAFVAALRSRFTHLSNNHDLFQTDVTGDEIWAAYLASFPEGTNPIFRVRTHYDGSIDRSVIRRIGNVVALIDGELRSIWDFAEGELPFPFDVVAAGMRDAAMSKPVTNLYLSDIAELGCESNIERLENNDTLTWNHFHVTVNPRLVKPGEYAAIRGQWRTDLAVFRRALDELTLDALNTIMELIEAKSLYRGDQYEKAVRTFREHKQSWLALGDNEDAKAIYLLSNYKDRLSADFRGSAIGSLAVDLSAGRPLEAAVASFDLKVAPGNYRHSTAIITSGMVDRAMETIRSLNLEPALERRHAYLSDLTINNVIWADRKASFKMKGGVESLLRQETDSSAEVTGVVDITSADFLLNIVPKARSMEVRVLNEHTGNLVSLTAPVHADSERLFQWDNNFGWSYNGNVTDSIRERVKAAGGNVDAAFRVSLSWFNHDDLDLHCFIRPTTGPHAHINFSQPMGILDVDMNAHPSRLSRQPVENMAFRTLSDGDMDFMVHSYQYRESGDVGFELQVELNGQVEHFRYQQAVRHREQVHVFSYRIQNGIARRIGANPQLVNGLRSQTVWGIKTNTFVPVQMLLHSPNYWDDQTNGNHHLFFILKDCLNDQPARGIFNEFLRSELHTHRKVFEVLADKTKCAVTDQQLSGLGFSSTIRNHATVRVDDGVSTRCYNVYF